MKATQRTLIKQAERHGLEVLAFEHTGGTHYKLRVKNGLGNTAFFVFANSCSDSKHAHKNNESMLRRFADGTFDPRTKH